MSLLEDLRERSTYLRYRLALPLFRYDPRIWLGKYTGLVANAILLVLIVADVVYITSYDYNPVIAFLPIVYAAALTFAISYIGMLLGGESVKRYVAERDSEEPPSQE